MRIELEEQGIAIKGHTLGNFSGWAEIDEDTGTVETLVIYEDVGVGANAKRIEVDLSQVRDAHAAYLRIILSATIYESERVRAIVHERQQSRAHDRMAARSGDRAYNAEL